MNWTWNLTEVGSEDPNTGEPLLKAFNNIVLVDSDKLDDDTAGAIIEVSQDKNGALHVKFADKRSALVDLGKHLGKHLGTAVERQDVDVTPHNVVADEPLSPEEWEAEVAGRALRDREQEAMMASLGRRFCMRDDPMQHS